MRVHRQDYHSDRALASELTWLNSLRDAGVQTTRCIPCRDGAPFTRVATTGLPEGRQCDLLEWVPGKPVGSLEDGVQLPDDTRFSPTQNWRCSTRRVMRHVLRWLTSVSARIATAWCTAIFSPRTCFLTAKS